MGMPVAQRHPQLKSGTRCWPKFIGTVIPLQNYFEGGIWKTEDAIHPMCAAEMYSFGREQRLVENLGVFLDRMV